MVYSFSLFVSSKTRYHAVLNISKVAYSHTLGREATLKPALELLDSRRADITRAILPRKQSPSVSNSQRGRSCERIF